MAGRPGCAAAGNIVLLIDLLLGVAVLLLQGGRRHPVVHDVVIAVVTLGRGG